MRHGGAVFDDTDFEANGLERPNSRFATRTWTFDANFNFAHAMGHSLAGGVLGDLLSGEGGALSRAFESDTSGG